MKHEDLRLMIEARWPGAPVASTRQLAAAGLEERALTAAVRGGVLLRLRRGAYVRSSQWNQAKPWERDSLRIHAHYESTGGAACYSHTSAARLQSCQVWNGGPLVHVTTSYANSSTSTGPDVRTHRLPLDASEVKILQTADGRDFQVTTLERTVIDCARILRPDAAAVVGDAALRKGADLATMRRMLEDSPVKRGSRRAAAVLDSLDGRAESAGETRTRLLLRSFGVVGFQPQYELPTTSGLFRADFADPARRVIIEFDGKAKYAEYGPTDQVLLAERSRENALVEAGWIFLRLEWQHLDAPMELRRRLQATLARADMQKRPRTA
ncbi:very-short-patch-repair endonuclease/predicted transcriptional regulator of viral defense system [Arthrobacter pascens]|uniref:type IV toxin-antitoxin system AbiEi family antitoxin domain-containing protein n=1 Tax=Arthrobacter pascens TaxID=1677 RepID=UPI0028630AFD|nr:type IV toxin-antitoxin system AbiEi family antitoxin domain-containing protein [Arthrobacter pascens]MDR6555916.1 very-short-patch-repair endonuclease/predicted transcriptional regulator of viral defense system [Arthrobacter pascens]